MNYQEFNQFCQAMPHSTYVQQWGDSHVWKVGDKVFAIGGWGDNKQPAFTVKTSQLDFEFYRMSEGYRPAPYFANRGMLWIQQTDTSGHLDEELKALIEESYRLVVQGLTKRKRAELGL